MKFLVTCEHAGNKIPPEYKNIFVEYEELLNSHRGFDEGALDLANYLSKNLADAYYFTDYSRLLIDANRSDNNRSLYSVISKKFTADEKIKIREKYYYPHRMNVVKYVDSEIQSHKNILHIAVHSFVPILFGKIRNADMGLLYDPARKKEKNFSRIFREKLKCKNPYIKLRMNYPYKGTDDGLATHLRKKYNDNYIGFELEMNQKLLSRGKFPEEIKSVLKEVLAEILNQNEKLI